MELENVRSSSPLDDPTRMGGVAPVQAKQKAGANPLDSVASKKLFTKLLDWYQQELDRQAANRYQMALDHDYYDALQWTEEDANVLINRGQAPLVFNEVKPTIDWLIGTERRTRMDYKVLPRRKDGLEDAETKSKLMKYLSDTNKTEFQRSAAFSDAVKSGLGWLETGIRGDDSEELLYTRAESWRNMLYDSNAVESDLSDARYVFRWKWLDEDIAAAYFPDRKDLVRKSVADANQIGKLDSDMDDAWFMGARVTSPGHDYAGSNVGKYMPYDGAPFSVTRRPRVKMIECWYRTPVLQQFFASGELYNTQFDPKNPSHVEALQGGFSLYDKLNMEIRCALFTSSGLVFDGKSPYKHGKIPFVPIWCYRRKRDNAPYGCIRNLRDPQDDLNKRASKALWILSSNRIIAEVGAVDDWDLLREEAARPDSLIVKNKGAVLTIDRDVQLANEHLQLMERDIQHIRNVGGVTSESLGRDSNATSGKAILAKQDQGSVVTTEPFDNLRFATQCLGEMELSNIEQFYTASKIVRVVGARGAPKFIEINQQAQDGSILNDITAFQTDFVMAEQDFRSTLRQSMFESLFDITGRLAQMNPQLALNMLDLVIEMADLPNRDELVQRIRKLSGQTDPDKEITPEEQQQQQQEEQKQKAQQEIVMGRMQAELDEIKAKGSQLQAETVMKRVEAMYAALQAAQVVATVPAAGAVADEIMHGAGFTDESIQPDQSMIQNAALQMQPAAAAQVAQQPGGVPPLADLQPLQGAGQGLEHGIETMRNDGAGGQ